MGVEIFVKTEKTESLDEFAKKILRLLDISNYEKRESSSYVNGEYYAGTCCGLRVKIAIADINDSRLQNYQFGITIDCKIFMSAGRTLEQYLIDYLARLLAKNHYDVAVLDSPYNKNSLVFLYKRNPAANTLENEITIEQLK
jgi:hypothetical protein